MFSNSLRGMGQNSCCQIMQKSLLITNIFQDDAVNMLIVTISKDIPRTSKHKKMHHTFLTAS